MAGGEPPEEAYGRVTNPERFAPLHDVATDLVDRLCRDFAVRRDDQPDVTDPLAANALRAVRLTPVGEGAPLTLVWTRFPGVYVVSGEGCAWMYPPCGCDACDDDLDQLARHLEADVMALVRGHFTEYRQDGGRSGHRIDYFDDEGLWTGQSSSAPGGDVRAHRWPAWTKR